MLRMRSLQLFSLVVLLSLTVIFATAGPVFSEMTLNDNVNIEGALSLDGENSGLNFADWRRQTTAASPPWYQVLPGNQRFELVMNNEAVLDRETGLVWERDTSNDWYTWYEALDHCYSAYIGGRGGWRLPTIAELATLIDETQTDPVLPAGHPFINVKLVDSYWSSTTSASFNNFAWLVNFGSGAVHSDYNSYSYYVRAVRFGQ